MRNQVIKCLIETCVYNSPDHYCTLNCIMVAPCAPKDSDSVMYRSDSMCSNFKKKEGIYFDRQNLL